MIIISGCIVKRRERESLLEFDRLHSEPKAASSVFSFRRYCQRSFELTKP